MQQLHILLDLIFEQLFDRLDQPEAHNSLELNAHDRFIFSQTHPAMLLSSTLPPQSRPGLKPAVYRLADNPHGLKAIGLDMREEQLMLQMVYGDARDGVLPFHFGQILSTQGVFCKDLALHRQEVVTAAAWQDRDSIQLTLIYPETPYIVTYITRFRPAAIQLTFQMNVSLNLVEYSTTGILTAAGATPLNHAIVNPDSLTADLYDKRG
ncbi:hypothetical protein D3C80_1418670 [compost metagenome]